MDRIILLGGAPAIGKTFIAKFVAERLGIPCISTDAIRQEMRRALPRDQFPALFALDESVIGHPVDFLQRRSVQEIVEDVARECEDVWIGVESLIRNHQTRKAQVIEGIAITPAAASLLVRDLQYVRAAILVNSDARRIKAIIDGRGLGGPPERFPASVRQKQFEWVQLSNQRYRMGAERADLAIVDLSDKSCVDRIVDVIA